MALFATFKVLIWGRHVQHIPNEFCHMTSSSPSRMEILREGVENNFERKLFATDRPTHQLFLNY